MRVVTIFPPPLLAVSLAVVLSGAVSPAHSKVPKEMLERAFSTLQAGVRSGDFTNRSVAVSGLAWGPKKDALPLVKEALDDPQWQVRRAAIEASLLLKDKSWETAILDAMKSEALDPTEEVLPLLEPVGEKAAVALVLRALSDPKFPNPDRYTKAIAKRGGSFLVEAWLGGLKLKNDTARREFETGLAELPLPDAVPVYQKVLATSSPEVQARVLDRILADPRVTDLRFLEPLLKKGTEDVKLRVAAALAQRGNDKGKSLLVAAVEKGSEAEKQVALEALLGVASEDLFEILKPIVNADEASTPLLRAAYAIYAKVGNPKLAGHLEKRLMSTDLEKRAAAVRVLGKIKGRAALENLHPLLGDGSVLIRREAAWAIGDIGRPESIEPIRQALFAETDTETRLALVDALARIRTPEIVPVLQQHIYDSSDEIRKACLRALDDVQHQSTVELLELLLQDRNPEIRSGALVALLELGPERQLDQFRKAVSWLAPERLESLVATHKELVLPHLKMALQSDREPLHDAALRALSTLPAERQSEVLRELALKDQRAALRVRAIDALAAAEGKKAVDVLQAIATEKDARVKVAAIAALGRLRAPGTEEVLVRLMDDTDERVRLSAASALLRI